MAYQQCKICGKKLKNPLYKKIGYGPICYKKLIHQKTKYKILFDTRRGKKK